MSTTIITSPVDVVTTEKSVQFNNGVTNERAYRDSPGIGVNVAGTICGWVKFNSLPASNGLYTICGYGGRTSVSNFGTLTLAVRYNLASIGASKWRLEIFHRKHGFSQSNHVYGSTDLATGVWYFVSFGSSGSSWRITINGVAETLNSFIGSSSNTGEWWGQANPLGTQTLAFGSRMADGSWGNQVSAQLYRWLYNSTQLTPTQITNLYASGVPRTYAQAEAIIGGAPTRYWPLADPTDVTGTLKETVASQNMTTENMDAPTNYIADTP